MKKSNFIVKICGWSAFHNKQPILKASDALDYLNTLLAGLHVDVLNAVTPQELQTTIVSIHSSFNQLLINLNGVNFAMMRGEMISRDLKIPREVALDDFLVDAYQVPYSVIKVVELLRTHAQQTKKLLDESPNDYYQLKLMPVLQETIGLTEALVQIAIDRCEANFWTYLIPLLKKYIAQLAR